MDQDPYSKAIEFLLEKHIEQTHQPSNEAFEHLAAVKQANEEAYGVPEPVEPEPAEPEPAEPEPAEPLQEQIEPKE